ncbi:MAG: WD40/YVTN/BNR-like repeat-containing protein [Gemmatimonadales bacterium]
MRRSVVSHSRFLLARVLRQSRGPPILRVQQSGTTNRLQAISPVNSQVVWASGVGGTFVRTTDGGRHWQAGVVEGAELLQFRDVHGVSATVAYLLSAGVGPDSRIYKTVDGGETWQLQFQSPQADAFYDRDFWTVAFADPRHGWLVGTDGRILKVVFRLALFRSSVYVRYP